VRRYIEGIVPHKTDLCPVQSSPRTRHGGGEDESGEGDDYGIDETPDHLTRTVWAPSILTEESHWYVCRPTTAAQVGIGLGEYSGGLGAKLFKAPVGKCIFGLDQVRSPHRHLT